MPNLSRRKFLKHVLASGIAGGLPLSVTPVHAAASPREPMNRRHVKTICTPLDNEVCQRLIVNL